MKSRDELIKMIRECRKFTDDAQDRVEELERQIQLNDRARRTESWVSFVLIAVAFSPIFLRRSPKYIAMISIPVWVLVIGYLGLVSAACSLYILWERRRKQDAAQVHAQCTKCGYDLDGLDSAVGPDLWVGPERCPECGLEFPAVG